MDEYLQVHRQVMQHSKTLQNKKVSKDEAKWLESSENATKKIKNLQTKNWK